MNAIERYTLRACVDVGLPIEVLTEDTRFSLWTQLIVRKLILDNFDPSDLLNDHMLDYERHLIRELAKRLRVIYRGDVIPTSWTDQ